MRIKILACAVLLNVAAGCDQQNQSKQPNPRPVKVVRVSKDAADNVTAYAAEVRPRRETALSFRVPGKLIARPVEAGDVVRKGQVLAELDSADFRLAVSALQAQLKSAEAEQRFSGDELARYRDMLAQHVVSQPDLDRRQTAETAATARVEALKAQLAQAVNQLEYTHLTADRDGVITVAEADSSQVVGAGQSVVKLAQLDDKDVWFDLPEQRIGDVRVGQEVDVRLWADRNAKIKTHIREIAAAADPASRTFRIKAALPAGQTNARLGMTATVWLSSKAEERIGVPLAAVFTSQAEPKQPKVRRLDEQTGTVRAVPVKLGAALPSERIEADGLPGGTLIVSAGAHRLVEGQAVNARTILD
ncbi:MAG: efflux RND transporter periplasmic adaptor subunit [Methylobacter sp.]